MNTLTPPMHGTPFIFGWPLGWWILVVLFFFGGYALGTVRAQRRHRAQIGFARMAMHNLADENGGTLVLDFRESGNSDTCSTASSSDGED